MKIMKQLNDSTLDSVIESNRTFPHQMFPCGFASNASTPFVRILADGGDAAAPNGAEPVEPTKARSEGARFGLAVLAVIGAGTLWGWAIMQLCGLFLQAESVLFRNIFPLS
jgi:hypothetical protein